MNTVYVVTTGSDGAPVPMAAFSSLHGAAEYESSVEVPTRVFAMQVFEDLQERQARPDIAAQYELCEIPLPVTTPAPPRPLRGDFD